MAKWEAALQSGAILAESSKAEMWTRAVLNNGSTSPYGFGWELDDLPSGVRPTGVRMIRHEGTIPGFRGGFARFPAQHLGVIVLTNLDRAMIDSFVAGIAVRYAPELLPAASTRWDRAGLGLKN